MIVYKFKQNQPLSVTLPVPSIQGTVTAAIISSIHYQIVRGLISKLALPWMGYICIFRNMAKFNLMRFEVISNNFIVHRNI